MIEKKGGEKKEKNQGFSRTARAARWADQITGG